MKKDRSMLEAVIWDFGGVFTTSPFENFRRFEAERGLPQDFLRTVISENHDHNAWARFERSDIDLDGFDRAFAEETAARGHEVRGRDLVPHIMGEIRPEVVAALRTIKGRQKVGLITNNMMTSDEGGFALALPPEKAAKFDEILGLFDHVIESAKAGVRKPEPRIYEMMCEALGVNPDKCAFIDDLGINCKPAAALGMTAIKFRSSDQALGELEAALGYSLRG
jgi:putative hydrolase of the HAD superfamily